MSSHSQEPQKNVSFKLKLKTGNFYLYEKYFKQLLIFYERDYYPYI